MKNNLLLLIGFLLLLLLLLLCLSCQEETIVEDQEPKSFFKISHLSNNDIKTNSTLTQKLQTFQGKGNKNNQLSREVYNSEYDFYIETDSVKFMESDDGRFHSYTFSIARDSSETSLRNLVLYSYDNSDYDATLLTYDLTASQAEELEASDHISSSYYVHAEELDANFSAVMSAAPPCEPYVLTFHTTPDSNETFLFTDDSVCQHVDAETNETSCDVFTIVLIDCNLPGGPSGSENSGNDGGSDVTWEYGSGSSTYDNDSTVKPFVTGSSPKAPLFTKQFLTFLNSLPQAQQDFLDSSLENFNFKIKLQNFLNVNGYSIENEILANNFLNILEGNPDLTFEEIMSIEWSNIFGDATFFEPPVAQSSILITDLDDYFDCFTVDSNSVYKVTIYVDQPINGSREPYVDADGNTKITADKNTINVGHTFVGFSQSVNGFTTESKIAGLYPSGPVSPNSPSVSAMYINDENHPYDIALAITVDSSQFFDIINEFKIIENYDINDNNCTDQGLDCLEEGGILLPDTEGSWFMGNGGGSNPADLGEDIRNLPLAQNMTRFSMPSNAPSNVDSGC